jgi:hypothetical protein
MSNTIKIFVQNLPDVMALYDKIKVYQSATVSGTYVEITNSGTRPILNNQDNLYFYTHTGGIITDFYKTSYYNTGSTAESTLSDAISADPVNQLKNNMQVIVALADTITDVDGNALIESQFFFTTKYDPMYSSVRKVRLEIGSFLQSLDDDAINFAIFEASLASDQLGFIKSTSAFYIWARREWVTCAASSSLLHNVISGLRSKRLDNLDVTYDFEKRGQAMLDKTEACMEKWLKELQSGGMAVQKPIGFVKGECDPEAPNVGRMWEKGPFVQQVAMSNLRYRPLGARRYIAGNRRIFSKLR